jgi:hypothetical protein
MMTTIPLPICNLFHLWSKHVQCSFPLSSHLFTILLLCHLTCPPFLYSVIPLLLLLITPLLGPSLHVHQCSPFSSHLSNIPFLSYLMCLLFLSFHISHAYYSSPFSSHMPTIPLLSHLTCLLFYSSPFSSHVPTIPLLSQLTCLLFYSSPFSSHMPTIPLLSQLTGLLFYSSPFSSYVPAIPLLSHLTWLLFLSFLISLVHYSSHLHLTCPFFSFLFFFWSSCSCPIEGLASGSFWVVAVALVFFSAPSHSSCWLPSPSVHFICFITFKGTVARDFWQLVFFHQSIPHRTLMIRGLKTFHIWLRIYHDIRFCSYQNRLPRSQWDHWSRLFFARIPL